MRLNQYLITEKRRRNVIVCDIQPEYASGIHFDLEDFTDFLFRNNKILYLYNGPETVGGDTPQDIVSWLYEDRVYERDFEEVDDKLRSDFTFIDKGYAFLRGWMDQGVDDRTIIQALRYMAQKKEWDSRDIDPDEWVEQFPDLEGIYFDDLISFPGTMQLNDLKKWSGSLICGGGRNECLKEMQLLMNAFNIKYTEVKDFIYG